MKRAAGDGQARVGVTIGALLLCLFLTVLVWFSVPAMALETTLSARYHGQSSGEFENTTPPGAYCARWPDYCRRNFTATLPITYTKVTTRHAPNVREQFYVKLPGRRQLEVEEVSTGRRYPLTFEFTAVSMSMRRVGEGVIPLGSYLPSGCILHASISDHGQSWGDFIWGTTTPQSPAPCWSSNSSNSYNLPMVSQVQSSGVSYRLIMPRPIGMVQGLYRGSLQYSIGPNGDFDFGDGVSDLSGDQLTINFELEVRHDLYLNFPPGTDRAVLEPPGGWLAWMAGRGVPNKLYRDLPFTLWTTGPIKIYKHCQFTVDHRCGIENKAGHRVPVDVAVTLPGGLIEGGAAIERRAVPTGEASALLIEAQRAVINQPAKLHFSVAEGEIGAMLNHAGQAYQGQVTLLFDAQI